MQNIRGTVTSRMIATEDNLKPPPPPLPVLGPPNFMIPNTSHLARAPSPRPGGTACFVHWRCCALAVVTSWVACVATANGQGFVYPGVGPVNRSMAGAAVAAPLDAAGALHWNPGAVSGLAASELNVGVELHMPRLLLQADAPPDAFGAGSPPLASRIGSHNGATLLPSIAWVYQPSNSLWSYGLGVFSVGGFDVNYEADPNHPITANSGYGLGALSSHFSALQVAPTIARQLTDHVAVGFSPVLTMAQMGMSNALFAAPDDASGDGVFTYPNASFSPMRYGMGFQAGIYSTTPSRWHLGASIKSKQWIEEFVFRTTDEAGDAQSIRTQVEYPMIVSVGAAYSGMPRLLLAVDVRYINFSGAKYFGDAAVFRPDRSLAGLGWRDSTATSLGCQYLLGNAVSIRVGYGYGQSPVSDADVAANLQVGEFWNHMLTMGATIHLTGEMSMSVSYVRTFDKSSAGPIRTADGVIPGSNVAIGQRADAITTGISMQF